MQSFTVIYENITVDHSMRKLDSFGDISIADSMDLTIVHCDVIGPNTVKTGEIMSNNAAGKVTDRGPDKE